MADDADHLVILALLQIAFLGSVMTKDWVQGIGYSPVYQILLLFVVRAVMTSQSAWTSSAGILSTPADFPFLNDCTAASTFLVKDGVAVLCVRLGTVQY